MEIFNHKSSSASKVREVTWAYALIQRMLNKKLQNKSAQWNKKALKTL